VAACAGKGQALTIEELRALTEACKGRYRDVVPMLALAGLRWGELAGLRVGDRVSVPRPGLRLRRTVLASGGGALYVDTLKNHRAWTVPLVLELVPIVDRWGAGARPRQLQACPASGFMICVIQPRRCGWPLVRTRRWFNGCSGMQPRR